MPQLDTEQNELVEEAVARWEAYAPVFAAIAARLQCSRAEAVAFAAFLVAVDDTDSAEPWKPSA